MFLLDIKLTAEFVW